MKKAKCNANLMNNFIAGKEYEIIYVEDSFAILRDESKMPHAVKEWKEHFTF